MVMSVMYSLRMYHDIGRVGELKRHWPLSYWAEDQTGKQKYGERAHTSLAGLAISEKAGTDIVTGGRERCEEMEKNWYMAV